MPEAHVFQREGDFWTLVYEGRVSRIAHAKGLHHLARLLANPGRELHALDLAGEGAALGGQTTNAGPVLDATAKAAYRRRVADLRDELDEAERFADLDRASRLRAELQAITDELTSATGLGGRDRMAADNAERARLSVTKAIRAAMRRIAQHDPALADHLTRTIRTGIFCSYQPDPRVAVAWGTQPAGQPLRPDPLTSRSLGTSGTPLVGRERERAELHALVSGAARGRGTLVVLVGEPGAGKTRLAADALGAAAALGMLTVAGRCSDAGESTPYLPFVQVIEELVEVLPQGERDAALGEDAAEVAKVAPGLRRVLPALRPAAVVPPEQEQRVVLDAVRAFLGRVAANRGLVIVVDDLQWADEATLRLVEHLADGLDERRLLLIGTSREEGLELGHPLARTWERLVRRHAWHEVRLKPLPPPAVAAMLEALADQPPPDALTRTVVTQTGGNPFFVEQLYGHLVDQDALFDDRGAFRAQLSAVTDVPVTVRLVLGHRLAQLSQPARSLLDAAAVIGREADCALASEVTGLDSDTVLAAIEDAERAHLVRVEADGIRDRIVFRHDLVRHTLLSDLSLPRRRRLHAQVADALERAGSDGAAVLAEHLLQAGALVTPERTVAALHRAASEALAAAAFDEAHRLLNHALDRCADPDSRAALLFDLGLAERALGQPEAAIGHWSEALAFFEWRGDVERAADLCLELGRAMENAGRWAEGAAAARRGLAGLPDGPSLRRVNLLAHLVNSSSFAGEFSQAATALDEAQAASAALRSREAEGRVLTVRAMNRFTRMAFPEAAAAARSAIDVLEPAGDLYWAAMAGTLCQRCLTYIGHLAEASAMRSRLDRIGDRVGHVFITHNERNTAVLDVLITGDLDRFAARTQEDLERCRSGALRWLADAEAQAGLVAFWRGDWDTAIHHLEEGARLEPPGAYRGRYQAPLLRVLAYLGRRDSFRTRWEGLADRDRSSLGGRFATLAAAEALALLGACDESAALYGEVAEALATGLVLAFVDLRLLQTVAGVTAAAAGDWHQADEHFETAVAQTDTLPHRIEAAEARRLWGWALLERGDPAGRAQARVLLAEAADRYHRLGMPRHLTLTEAQLARC